MGILMNINIYAERIKGKNKHVGKNTLEKIFLDYNMWLQKNNREDKAENYENFLKLNKKAWMVPR